MKSFKKNTLRSLFQVIFLLFALTLPVWGQSLPSLVAIEEVQPREAKTRLERMRGWFQKNQDERGALRYQLDPLKKRNDEPNNLLRQWMATWALFDLADFLADPELRKAAEKNLAYNAQNYLVVEETKKIAYVYGENSAKLGAAAFALMSFRQSREFPQRKQRMAYLLNFILSLQNEDGSFRTFYLPLHRNDNQNFYPGEAALALTIVEADAPGKDPRIKPALKEAFAFYRGFFRENPNPAFIPWWTQALYRLQRLEPSKEYRDFIFEMNDFLIAIQNTPQQPKNPDPIGQGHFFDPRFASFGAPHASSTAIYAEGLVDALKLARQVGDRKRSQAYAYAIRWAFRSLFQLQYDERSAAEKPFAPFLVGGLRSAENRWDIRVDNVQHAAMAMMNLFSEKSLWPEVLKAQ